MKHNPQKQLHKTFTCFKTSTINQADQKKKGILAHVETKYQKTPNQSEAAYETNRETNRSQISAEMKQSIDDLLSTI